MRLSPLLAVPLLLVPGCIGQDLIDGSGTFDFYLRVRGPEGTALGDLSFFHLFLLQSVLVPADNTERRARLFGNGTLLDIVEMGVTGSRLHLQRYHGDPKVWRDVGITFAFTERAAFVNGSKAVIALAPNGYYHDDRPPGVAMGHVRHVVYELVLMVVKNDRGSYRLVVDPDSSRVVKNEIGPIL